MSIYKVIDGSFEEKGNNGGPQNFTDKQKQKIVSDIREKINTIENIKNQLPIIETLNSFYIFYLEYNEIPPKTSRFKFREPLQNINDIPQKGIKTIHDENGLRSRIYYEITNDEVLQFVEKIECILSEINSGLITDWPFAKKLSKIIDFGVESEINRIAIKTHIRILPIESAISQLKDLRIIRNDNFFEESSVVHVTPEEFHVMYNLFPQIIVDDFSNLSLSADTFNYENYIDEVIIAGNPSDQIIGIIDSGNSLDGAFLPYIDSILDVRENPSSARDFSHGSQVASIIIANDELNPSHADGYGNFKVKHFEIMEYDEYEGTSTVSFHHLRRVLLDAVSSNRHIKVWNLSLGGLKIPFTIMMSPISIFLDKLAVEYDVLFCIAAGNERSSVSPFYESINQPADSLNGLAVGSVKTTEKGITFSDYSSFGPILHFEKPDVSDWGGPNNKDSSSFNGAVNSSRIIHNIKGTSFSTPRIARMAAHFISQGLTVKEAKAKIISLATREVPTKKSSAFGYVDKSKSTFDLKATISLNSNKPLYLPINLIDGIDVVSITSTYFVKPIIRLGEEYAVHDIETGLIWYDELVDNPEYALNGGSNAKRVRSDILSNDKFEEEAMMRFEKGKYFNSKKKICSINSINKCKIDNYKLGVRLRKLDLFETIEQQELEVSVIISFEGIFNENALITANESIIDISITQEIEI